MTTSSSSLSQLLSRLQTAPYSVQAQLPASLSSSRSPVDVRLANLALTTALGEPNTPHVKLCAAAALREIDIDTETLKKLAELLQTASDPYSKCAALTAIHPATIADQKFIDTSIALQHELLDLFSSKDDRLRHHAISAFVRLHRYGMDSSVAVLNKVSGLLDDGDLPLPTRLRLLALLSRVAPDSDVIAVCMRQIDVVLADRTMDVGMKSRILTAATNAILQRPASPTPDVLDELLGRHLHDHVLAAGGALPATQFAALFADAVVADDSERSRLALRALHRCSGSLPDVLRQHLLSLLRAMRHVPQCLAVLARHSDPAQLQLLLVEVVDRSEAPLDKRLLIHINALVRRDLMSGAVFVERLVARSSSSSGAAVANDLFVCLAYCLRLVQRLPDALAADLADLCQDTIGVPGRLRARVCLLAAGRSPAAVATRFHAVVDDLLKQSESSFGRYLICVECLMHGRAGGAVLAHPVLFGLVSAVSPAFAGWFSALASLADSQRGEWHQGAAIPSLYAARQAIAGLSLPGKEVAFQLDYLELRLEFLEAFGGWGGRPIAPSQGPRLEAFAARFNRLTCLSVSLSPATQTHLRRIATLCRTATGVDTLLDLLTSTTPAGFFTLYPADLAFARASVSDSGLLSITVRVRAALRDCLRDVSALVGEDDGAVPLEFRKGTYAGETSLADAVTHVRIVILGTDQAWQQWQLGTILFSRS